MRDRILELIQPAIEALREQKKLNHKSDWVFVNPNTKNHGLIIEYLLHGMMH